MIPQLVDGAVYVHHAEDGSRQRELHAIDARKGADLWKLAHARASQHLATDGAVVTVASEQDIASRPLDLVAMEADTGAERWRPTTQAWGRIAIADNIVYIATPAKTSDTAQADSSGAAITGAVQAGSAERVGGELRANDQPIPGVTIVIEDDTDGEIGRGVSDTSREWEVVVPDPGFYRAHLETTRLPQHVELRDPGRNPIEVRVDVGRSPTVNFALDTTEREEPGWPPSAIDVQAGLTRWTWTNPCPQPAPPFVHENRLYVHAGDALLALKTES